MNVYKKSIYIMAGLSVISFLSAVFLNLFYNTQKENDFWINILIGIFASSLLVLISSIISYFNEKNKTKAKINYDIKQLYHQLTLLDLYLSMCGNKLVSEIIQQVYQTDYIINGIFIDLSLCETSDICGNEIFHIITLIKNNIENLAINLYNNRINNEDANQINQFINKFRASVHDPREKYDNTSLLSLLKNYTDNPKISLSKDKK